MKNKEIMFSIIMCTYNGSKKIKRSLESVFSQNFPSNEFEVIVVDDGSTDDVCEVASKFPIILVTHQTNLGISETRNSGLKKSQGKYIVCMDDDCTINENFLSELQKKYESSNVMGVAADLVYPEKTSLTDEYFAAIWYGVATPKCDSEKKSIFSRLLWYYSNSPWDKYRKGYADDAELIDVPGACSSYRADLVKDLGGWDTSLMNSAEDNDLTLRMVEKYKDRKIILALQAKVVHFQELSFLRTMQRDFQRRDAKLLFYKKHHMFPVVFPNPLIFLIVFPLIQYSLTVFILTPFLLYPWWIKRAVSEKNWRFLTFPYMQLIQEMTSNISLLFSLSK